MDATAVHAVDITTTVEDIQKDIEVRISHLLKIYPYLSRGMIQQGLGPGTPPKLWDPILKAMVEKGEVKCVTISIDDAPSGRVQSKTIYHLPCFPYPPITI